MDESKNMPNPPASGAQEPEGDRALVMLFGAIEWAMRSGARSGGATGPRSAAAGLPGSGSGGLAALAGRHGMSLEAFLRWAAGARASELAEALEVFHSRMTRSLAQQACMKAASRLAMRHESGGIDADEADDAAAELLRIAEPDKLDLDIVKALMPHLGRVAFAALAAKAAGEDDKAVAEAEARAEADGPAPSKAEIARVCSMLEALGEKRRDRSAGGGAGGGGGDGAGGGGASGGGERTGAGGVAGGAA